MVYTDFIHAVSIIFDPKFLWKYELYIEGLYEAYGAHQAVMVRKVLLFFSLFLLIVVFDVPPAFASLHFL